MLNVFKKSINLKDISYAYANVKNIKGNFAVPQDNITNATNCFYGRNNSSQLNIVVNFGTASHNAFLVGMTNAGNGQIYSYNNTANMVMFNPLTTNMASAFKDDKTIIKAACGPNVKVMSDAYCDCSNLTGAPVCGSKVTNMAYAYQNCTNLTGSPVCGKKVTNMFYAYYNCLNMTGSPVCGPNVTDMSNTFYYCNNLTGSPVCGPNVINMSGTYAYCDNLTGSPVCGNNVTDMNCTYMLCSNLTGNPVCGNKVTDMFRTYDGCYNLTGCAIMGSNVINAFAAYRSTNIKYAYIYSDKLYNAINCFGKMKQIVNIYVPKTGYNATHNTLNRCLSEGGSSAITGQYTTWTNDMSINGCYYNESYNIYIYPVDNVAQKYKENELGIVTYTTTNTAMRPSFIMTDSEGNPISNYTAKINGNQVMLSRNNSSDVVTYVNFYDIKTLTSVSFMAGSITNMSNSFKYCFNLTGRPVCGNNVTNMFSTYYQCNNLTGAPVCGNKVANMSYVYAFCRNLTGQPVCGPNVTDMNSAYRNCINLKGSPACGPNVIDMTSAYRECSNLTGQPVCGDKVTDMYYAYQNCYKLTGQPVCGNNVMNMVGAYCYCSNLTGQPVCGPNVTSMAYAYQNCTNLTGSPVCGDKVISLAGAYEDCSNLTGNPVCGNNVTSMHSTYFNCSNLTGSPICGPNVTGMQFAYQNCKNLGHNGYFYSNKVSGVQNCFCGKDNSRRLNLYVPANSTTLTTCLYNNAQSLVGTNITWTSTSANSIYYNSIYYNTSYNIYIYPTIDITNVHRENELILAKYTINTPDAEVYNALPTFTGIEKNDYRTKEVLLDNGDTEITIVKSDENVPDPTRIEFKNQSILLSIDRLKLDNVTDASYMFHNCRNLCQINLNNFNTSTITNMDYMFAGCTSLTRKSFSLGTPYIKSVSGLDVGLPKHFSVPVSDVTMVEISDGKLVSISETFNYVKYTFGEVASIHVIIYKDTGEVEVYADAPQGAFEIRLYRGGMFDVSNVITADYMFDGCTNLL